ncbi:LOW QUALITY PROTEIN: putative uncharacterized protein C9orf62 homolog [Nomascus leucogenys]|uniref:LOW QUALITY PROTEIN: putative uncharacterized protein C9orf62 homolog n=1 Tax=Nomascus leucogenys TaxID=61853 RepID=UPI00122D518B|nr:LOW QUALITY PROTEIN: putative uncharacterized protein C9orf62 homolog [Nomascus leucogenys]
MRLGPPCPGDLRAHCWAAAPGWGPPAFAQTKKELVPWYQGTQLASMGGWTLAPPLAPAGPHRDLRGPQTPSPLHLMGPSPCPALALKVTFKDCCKDCPAKEPGTAWRGLVPVLVLTPGSPETHLELGQAFLGSRQVRHGRDAAPSSGQQGCSVDRTAGRPVLGWWLRSSLTGQEGTQHLHLSGIRTSRKPKEYKAVFFGATESSVHMAVAESLRELPPQGGWFPSSLFLKIF